MTENEVSALDATFLELEEADQSAHMHIGAVMLFDPPPGGHPPSLELLRAEIENRLSALPRFRQRLSAPRTGGLRWPRWVDDERFDIAHHVRAAGLPGAADEAALREWAGDFFSRRLDRARPLWELVLLELSDGRWALASKTHHCIVDGVGSVDVGQTILDLEPEPDPSRAREAEAWAVSGDFRAPGTSPSLPRRLAGLPLVAGAAGLRLAGLWLGLLRGAVGTVARTAVSPARGREALRRSRAMVDVLIRDELMAAPPTSLNEPIGAARSLAVVEAPLDELKAIKRTLGGTVNDVVLAVTAAGLRRLFEHRGEAPPRAGVRAMVPVNIRSAAERLALGNRITSLFVHLPVAEPDPLRRYELQLDEAERLKAGSQALGSGRSSTSRPTRRRCSTPFSPGRCSRPGCST